MGMKLLELVLFEIVFLDSKFGLEISLLLIQTLELLLSMHFVLLQLPLKQSQLLQIGLQLLLQI